MNNFLGKMKIAAYSPFETWIKAENRKKKTKKV